MDRHIPAPTKLTADPNCKYGCRDGILGTNQAGKPIWCHCIVRQVRRAESGPSKPATAGKGSGEPAEDVRARGLLVRLRDARQSEMAWTSAIAEHGAMEAMARHLSAQSDGELSDLGQYLDQSRQTVDRLHERARQLRAEADSAVAAAEDEVLRASSHEQQSRAAAAEHQKEAGVLLEQYRRAVRHPKRKLREIQNVIDKLTERLLALGIDPTANNEGEQHESPG